MTISTQEDDVKVMTEYEWNGSFNSYFNPIVWEILPTELDCLKPKQWLNDLVVNGYLYTFRVKYLSCMFISTHFFHDGGIKAHYWYPNEAP